MNSPEIKPGLLLLLLIVCSDQRQFVILEMSPELYEEIIELAEHWFSLSSLFAGFSLTIMVLLIQQHSSKRESKRYEPRLGSAAIITFCSAFFECSVAAYSFGMVASVQKFGIFEMYMRTDAGFILAFSTTLIALGIGQLLEAYKFNFPALPIKIIIYSLMIFVLIQNLVGTAYSIHIVTNLPFVELYSVTIFWILLYVVPIFILLLFLLGRWMFVKDTKYHFRSKLFYIFVYCGIGYTCILYFPKFFFIEDSPLTTILLIHFFVYVFPSSILLSWPILLVPTCQLAVHRLQKKLQYIGYS